MKQAFFRNLEKFKKENYEKLNIEYSKTNKLFNQTSKIMDNILDLI